MNYNKTTNIHQKPTLTVDLLTSKDVVHQKLFATSEKCLTSGDFLTQISWDSEGWQIPSPAAQGEARQAADAVAAGAAFAHPGANAHEDAYGAGAEMERSKKAKTFGFFRKNLVCFSGRTGRGNGFFPKNVTEGGKNDS